MQPLVRGEQHDSGEAHEGLVGGQVWAAGRGSADANCRPLTGQPSPQVSHRGEILQGTSSQLYRGKWRSSLF